MDATGLQPFSVVALGKWNPAILTPQGIGKRLFELPAGTQLEVEVALDVAAPPRIRREGLLVAVDTEKLVIEAGRDYEALGRAMRVARKALTDLPQTPMIAVGINASFLFSDVGLDESESLSSKLEGRLQAAAERIAVRAIALSVEWGSGRINMGLGRELGKPPTIGFNFERRSDQFADLVGWLEHPVTEIEAQVNRLLALLK